MDGLRIDRLTLRVLDGGNSSGDGSRTPSAAGGEDA
jgi:hypothetical protein